MLICKNCNKEYAQNLKFCPSCGSELIEKVEGTPADNAGAPSAAVEALVDSTKVENTADTSVNEKKCKKCGSVVLDSEKFCIKCGTPVNANKAPVNTEDTKPNNDVKPNEGVKPPEVKPSFSPKDRLQEGLAAAFSSNKFFGFFWKYAIVFALYYPIYLLMGRIDAFSDLVDVLDIISVPAFYAYYMCLTALFAKKQYLPLLIAFAIRFLNSFIILTQTESPISSICRIAILVTAFVFVFKEFRTSGQYQNLKSSFDTKTCSACGASVKASDAFCPKCGHKTGG